MALLSLIRVTHRYSRGLREVTVLDDVSLDLERGDYACVLAQKGEGKTTLLEVAVGMRRPNVGQVLFQGRNLGHLSGGARSRLLRSDIGHVWNRSVPIVIGESVLAHVGFPLRSARVGRKEWRRRAASMIERVGAAEYADAKVLELSQFQRMRIALAQACVRSPRLLVADELTDTLDVMERHRLLGLLQEFAREGMCVLMTAGDTHGAKGCTRLLSLRDGCLREAEMRAPAPAPDAEAAVLPFQRRSQGGSE